MESVEPVQMKLLTKILTPVNHLGEMFLELDLDKHLKSLKTRVYDQYIDSNLLHVEGV